jgi:nitroreductase
MENKMSVKEAILKRRASKVYLDEPAPSKADLDLITDAAL